MMVNDYGIAYGDEFENYAPLSLDRAKRTPPKGGRGAFATVIRREIKSYSDETTKIYI